jgi:SAM-dependent methyltransferase
MRCPACGLRDPVPIADLGEVPVLSGHTFGTADEAAASPRGPLRLAQCPACAHLVNTAFDSELMTYGGQYDNSLHHSATFADYATALVKHLTAAYQLAGRTVLELGCGNGEFLRELCVHAGARGFGYDESYVGPAEADGVRFQRRYLQPEDAVPDFDLFVSRHVLEHLADPYEFLTTVRRHAGDRPVRGYVEVPDARYDVVGAGWGCIYPHVGYFTGPSLAALLRRAGFQLLREGTDFGGLFRFAEMATTAPAPPHQPAPSAVRDDLMAAATLHKRHHAAVADWRARIRSHVAAGHRIAVWGVGARGAGFLAATDPERLVTAVDRNPAKHHRFLPCSAHRVVPPRELPGYGIDTVVLTNPRYEAEVRKDLDSLDIDAVIWRAGPV